MELAYFLRERTALIRHFYDTREAQKNKAPTEAGAKSLAAINATRLLLREVKQGG